MPYIIRESGTNSKPSYWQTPGSIATYRYNAQTGKSEQDWMHVGGRVWSTDAATKYPNREEAEFVNSIRGLGGIVEQYVSNLDH